MKKIILSLFIFTCLIACKSSDKKQKETQKEDSVVTTTIKTDKEKADSVFEYYQKKSDSLENVVPDMPTQ